MARRHCRLRRDQKASAKYGYAISNGITRISLNADKTGERPRSASVLLNKVVRVRWFVWVFVRKDGVVVALDYDLVFRTRRRE
jgi:hypothetical protein